MIAIIMTVGVYGLVAGIVKLDDLGFYLVAKASKAARKIGAALLWFTPHMMRGLSILGTIAMFTVGGGIITHGVPILHHFAESLNVWLSTLFNAGFGLLVGAAVLVFVLLLKKFKS